MEQPSTARAWVRMCVMVACSMVLVCMMLTCVASSTAVAHTADPGCGAWAWSCYASCSSFLRALLAWYPTVVAVGCCATGVHWCAAAISRRQAVRGLPRVVWLLLCLCAVGLLLHSCVHAACAVRQKPWVLSTVFISLSAGLEHVTPNACTATAWAARVLKYGLIEQIPLILLALVVTHPCLCALLGTPAVRHLPPHLACRVAVWVAPWVRFGVQYAEGGCVMSLCSVPAGLHSS